VKLFLRAVVFEDIGLLTAQDYFKCQEEHFESESPKD